MSHNRRYYYLEKLAAPPKPLTPRQEAEARDEDNVSRFKKTLQERSRRQNLSKLWDSMARGNPELKGRDDLKAQYIDSYMSNQEQMPDSEVQKQLQASNEAYDKGRVEHAFLPGDWRESETSRLMQLAGASKMNPTTGEMEEVPVGYDMYGRPITSKLEQAGQYLLRPVDSLVHLATKGNKALNEFNDNMNSQTAKDRDMVEFNKKVRSGEIPMPDNYDPKTTYIDDPDAQSNRNKVLKARADKFMEKQEDARAFSMAKNMRVDAEKTNRPTEMKRQTYEYFADPNRTTYQKYVVPVAERLGANTVEMSHTLGLDKLDKAEKKHPWLKQARKLTGPALKTFLTVAAVAQPELAPLIPDIIGAIELGEAGLSTMQAMGKGGANQQKQINENKDSKELGEYKGDPSAASGAAFLDVLSQIPGVKTKDGKIEVVNADKQLVSLGGPDNPLAPVADLTKNFAKQTGQYAEDMLTDGATDSVKKKMLNEAVKGTTSTIIAGTGNPVSPIIKPVSTTSKVVKPVTKDPSQMSPYEIYMARQEQLDNIRQERLAKNQPTNQPQQEVDSAPTAPTAPTYDSTYFQEQLGTGAQEQPIYDVSNMQQQQPQKGKTQIQSQVPAVNPPTRPVQQQAINPPPRPAQQPVPQQAVNPRLPTQPQTAQVKVTKPTQGIQVASVTPPTQGYKIK